MAVHPEVRGDSSQWQGLVPKRAALVVGALGAYDVLEESETLALLNLARSACTNCILWHCSPALLRGGV